MFARGLVFVIILWALSIAGVARIAQARGRSVALWGLAAAALGAVGCGLGILLVGLVIDRDHSGGLAMLAVLSPVAFMLAATGGLALVAYRLPIRVAQRSQWAVHFVGKGDGDIAITGDDVRFAWGDDSRTVRRAEIESALADGECVRIQLPNQELAVLPMGNPATPDGRRAQSRALAQSLAVALPIARAR